MIRAHRFRDVPHHRFSGEPRRLASGCRSTDSVRENQNRRKPGPSKGKILRSGQARGVDYKLRMHRGDQEMILVFLSYLALMGNPEEVELVVLGPYYGCSFVDKASMSLYV